MLRVLGVFLTPDTGPFFQSLDPLIQINDARIPVRFPNKPPPGYQCENKFLYPCVRVSIPCALHIHELFNQVRVIFGQNPILYSLLYGPLAGVFLIELVEGGRGQSPLSNLVST
ncbi:MAG: hypothetical protein BWY45_01684 [Euryarchaeota archaeon ADurb.Bin294]|nr:MAG: hypothetical protein BWY45_01684 [Euryarchaeota archaeon ADurb.Bin294]